MPTLRIALPLALLAFAASTPAGELPEIPYAVHPRDDVLVGGQPDEAALEQAAEAGVRYVVNLRSQAEVDALEFDERAVVEKHGMTYFHLPVAGVQDLSPDKVEAFDRIMQEIGDAPAILHCGSGNRVGAFVALRAGMVEGLETEAAIDKGRTWGLTGLDEAVRETLEGDSGE